MEEDLYGEDVISYAKEQHTYILTEDDNIRAIRLGCSICKRDTMLEWKKIVLGGNTLVYIQETEEQSECRV